jgi:hypothetical protein
MKELVCEQMDGVMAVQARPPSPKIDPEFKNLIQKLTEEERSILRDKLQTEGCTEPLAIWQEENLLLDGHHRIEICAELGIPYTTRAVSLPDRDAAKAWIARHQLGRRNSTEERKSYLRGLLHVQQSKGVGRPEKPEEGAEGNGVNFTPLPGRTRERLAEEQGVSPSTIDKDTRFYKDVEAVAGALGDGSVLEALTSGKATKAEVHALVGKDKEQAKKEIDEIRARPRKKQKRKGAATDKAAKVDGASREPKERRETPAGGAGGEELENWSSLEFHAGRLEDLALQARRLRKTKVKDRKKADVRALADRIRKAAENLERDVLGGPEI